jgi:hypothetical protein
MGDQIDRQVRDVDADPASLESLSEGNNGTAAAEWTQNGAGFVATGTDDSR